MAAIEGLLGAEVQNASKQGVSVGNFCGPNKVIGLYFSAHWCPPCRGFTPKLAEFYQAVKGSAKADQLEIVFISSDQDEGQWAEYFAEMPWLALPFADRERKTQLSLKFGVSGIPTLVFLDTESGSIITSDGRGQVTKDPEGKRFPWK